MIRWDATLWIDDCQHACLGVCPSAHACTGRPSRLFQQPADDFLQQRSLGVLGGIVTAGAPQWITDTHGSIIVALSNAEFVSFTSPVGSNVILASAMGNHFLWHCRMLL